MLLAAGLGLASDASWARDGDRDGGRDARARWVGTWTASPQTREPPFVTPTPAQFDNQTIRQIVHTSLGGDRIRVRLSNEFGTTPLVIGAVRLALQTPGGGAAIVPGTDRPLTFGGRPGVTLPAGAPMLSDPLDLDVPALTNLAISIHLPQATPATTFRRVTLPAIGLGSWITFNVGRDPVARAQCAAVMRAFFAAGGRMVDSSPMYGSAQSVIGEGLARIPRLIDLGLDCVRIDSRFVNGITGAAAADARRDGLHPDRAGGGHPATRAGDGRCRLRGQAAHRHQQAMQAVAEKQEKRSGQQRQDGDQILLHRQAL